MYLRIGQEICVESEVYCTTIPRAACLRLVLHDDCDVQIEQAIINKVQKDMYECLKFPFNKVIIDSMCDEDGKNASYVRLSYNGYYFYISYHYLRPVNRHFNSVACFMREQDIYVVAKKISSNAYVICWMGDCDCIEFRMSNIERHCGKSACWTLLLGAIALAFSFGVHSTSNTDTMAVYIIFLMFSTLGFALAAYIFLGTFSSDFRQFKELMRKNLMQENDLFLPLTTFANSDCEQLIRPLPKELSQRTVTVTSVYRERRKISAQYISASTDASIDESYTKCMINMVCNGDKFVFEYKESLFPREIDGTDIAPFIATGDIITLYWYEPQYEEVPLDSEESGDGIRIICLLNKTTNNYYESRINIEPRSVRKVMEAGGKGIYNSFMLY